jgi:hypothetical protein
MRSFPAREGFVRHAGDDVRGGSVIEVEITSRKLAVKGETGLLAVPPADSRWIGAGVTFVQTAGGGSGPPRRASVDADEHAPADNVARSCPRVPSVVR